MRQFVRITIVLTSLAIAGSSVPTFAADPTANDVVAALKRRAESLKSGRIEWEERIVYEAGAIDGLPAEDSAVDAWREFAWDAPRMAVRYVDPTPDIERTRFEIRTYANVCGGAAGNRILVTRPSIGFPTGRIIGGNALERSNDDELTPVLLWARPMAGERIRIDPVSCKVEPKTESIEGRACLVLTCKQGVRVERWYIDVEADFSTRRYEAQLADEKKTRIDVTYAQDGKSRWVPTGWQCISSGMKGRVVSVVTGTVRAMELDTMPDPKLFDLAWPRGTMVNDQVQGGTYIIRLDGTQRVVTQEDRVKQRTYREMLDPTSGK